MKFGSDSTSKEAFWSRSLECEKRLVSNGTLTCAIVCGGLATRLWPLTEKIPKSLITINGEPFISHQLRLLAANDVRKVVLCVGYLGKMIEDFVSDGEQFGVEVKYSFDSSVPLGTAGAVRNALQLLPESFFVLYGDSYLPCNYRAIASAFEAATESLALMTIYRNDNKFDNSNVEIANNRIVRYDKRNLTSAMHHIDYGLGVFRSVVFNSLPYQRPYDLADVYQDLIAKGQLASFEVKQRFYEIGSAQGIRHLEEHLAHVATAEL